VGLRQFKIGDEKEDVAFEIDEYGIIWPDVSASLDMQKGLPQQFD